MDLGWVAIDDIRLGISPMIEFFLSPGRRPVAQVSGLRRSKVEGGHLPLVRHTPRSPGPKPLLPNPRPLACETVQRRASDAIRRPNRSAGENAEMKSLVPAVVMRARKRGRHSG